MVELAGGASIASEGLEEPPSCLPLPKASSLAPVGGVSACTCLFLFFFLLVSCLCLSSLADMLVDIISKKLRFYDLMLGQCYS